MTKPNVIPPPLPVEKDITDKQTHAMLLIAALSITAILAIAITGLVLEAKREYKEAINQGRIEVFTGQVICRQIPLQGVEIQLECKTREEIEDLIRFMQPQGNIK